LDGQDAESTQDIIADVDREEQVNDDQNILQNVKVILVQIFSVVVLLPVRFTWTWCALLIVKVANFQTVCYFPDPGKSFSLFCQIEGKKLNFGNPLILIRYMLQAIRRNNYVRQDRKRTQNVE